jgi:putative phosphoserine phosphatase/1-acylglycerol-3-phosphate O-acyltransferase
MKGAEKIGAFFDLDGTLLAPPSLEWRFLAHLIDCDEISAANITRWLGRFAKTILRDRTSAVEANKLYLAGLRESLVTEWSAAAAPDSPPFFLDGVARLAWHHAQKHRTFLVTGTLGPLARAVAHGFPCPVEIVASELDVLDGHWTGWLAGAHMSSTGKASAIRALAARHGLDLPQSYAYGNHGTDLPMLEAVGNPTAVNPSRRLARLARMRGWRTCKWRGLETTSQAERTNLLRLTEAQ